MESYTSVTLKLIKLMKWLDTVPTDNPRVNITFHPETVQALAQIAKREKKSLASVAKELILEALDLREDIRLSKLAQLRDIEGLRAIPHQDAWR